VTNITAHAIPQCHLLSEPEGGSVNTRKAIQVLERHTKEEWRIHKELFQDASVDVRRLARKHWRDTKAIHVGFFKELKKAWKAAG
jgi:hypothetical protein